MSFHLCKVQCLTFTSCSSTLKWHWFLSLLLLVITAKLSGASLADAIETFVTHHVFMRDRKSFISSSSKLSTLLMSFFHFYYFFHTYYIHLFVRYLVKWLGFSLRLWKLYQCQQYIISKRFILSKGYKYHGPILYM